MSAMGLKVIDLPAHFAQVQLAGLKDTVEHHRENGCGVQFNAAEVERVDGAAIQFLVAVEKLQQQDSEKQLTLVNTNEVLHKAMVDMDAHERVNHDSTSCSETVESCA